MMQCVVISCQNWHEENSIARMLHLVQNSMSCNHVATILNAYSFDHTYDIGYVSYAQHVLSPSVRAAMHLNTFLI